MQKLAEVHEWMRDRIARLKLENALFRGGIDVPACRSAYILASSRNPRQFVQRRGRVLRRAPGKDVAEIVDFMVRIPDGIVERSGLERGLQAGELKRVAEFARLARNAGEVVETLMPPLQQHDLLHHLV